MSVNLTPTWEIGSLDLTGYPYSVQADGTVEVGEPEMVVESVASLLADGDLERAVRHGNRAYVLPVLVEGETLAELARAEADLRAEITKTGLLLTHDPGDGFAPASVYEVQTAKLTPARDDTFESHLLRKYTLTLTCSPFARSVDQTTITVLGPIGSPVTVNVSTADTTTGWSSAATASSFGATGGYVYAGTFGSPGGIPRASLSYSEAVNAVTPYYTIEWQNSVSTVSPPTIGDGRLAANASMGDGWTKTTYDLSARTGSLSWVMSGAGEFRIRNVSRSSAMPQLTSRENAAIIQIGGTERTPCSLQVNPAAGEAMGIGIVHTSPDSGYGYSPALRQRRISGNTVTTNATLISGASEGVTATPVVATVPVTSLPEDGYSLVALLKSSVVGTFPITYNVRTAFSGNYLGTSTPRTVPATFPTANAWTLIPLGNTTLPPVRASQQAFVQFDLSRTPVASEVIELDEWWAFRMGEDCALTMVQSQRAFLWLDSPDVTSPVPRVWVGNNGDRSDAHHPAAWLVNQGSHVLNPGGTSVFVATSGIANPSVTATAYRRWHSNAAS